MRAKSQQAVNHSRGWRIQVGPRTMELILLIPAKPFRSHSGHL